MVVLTLTRHYQDLPRPHGRYPEIQVPHMPGLPAKVGALLSNILEPTAGAQ